MRNIRSRCYNNTTTTQSEPNFGKFAHFLSKTRLSKRKTIITVICKILRYEPDRLCWLLGHRRKCLRPHFVSNVYLDGLHVQTPGEMQSGCSYSFGKRYYFHVILELRVLSFPYHGINDESLWFHSKRYSNQNLAIKVIVKLLFSDKIHRSSIGRRLDLATFHVFCAHDFRVYVCKHSAPTLSSPYLEERDNVLSTKWHLSIACKSEIGGLHSKAYIWQLSKAGVVRTK